MKIEVIEWAKRDECGDRPYMGKHFYSEAECIRIIKQGGSLEYGRYDLDTIDKVTMLFN